IAADLGRRASGDEERAEPPLVHALVLERARGLRYGENPHQTAALYTRAGDIGALHALREGKELSYNNLLDVEAAVMLAWRFWAHACVIVKHNQPCGAASAASLTDACEAALRSDEHLAYCGIVAINRPIAGEIEHLLAKQ